MSAVSTQVPPSELFRISVDQYHAMVGAGILTPDDKVELLEGVLVRRMSKNPPHVYAARQVARQLEELLPPGFFVSRQDPITLSDGEPEPDVMVVRGEESKFLDRHPVPAEAPLIVETTDSSLRVDRGIKLRSYARAGIAVYWIINLIDRQVEVYTDPDPAAEPEPTYRKLTTYDGAASIPVLVEGKGVGQISAASILP